MEQERYSIFADFKYPKHFTYEQVAEALAPVLNELEVKDWELVSLMKNEGDPITHHPRWPNFFEGYELQLGGDDEDFNSLYISLSGNFKGDLSSCLGNVLENHLDSSIELAKIETHNYNSVDMYESIKRVWGGSPDAVQRSRREHFIKEALTLFCPGDFSDPELKAVRDLLADIKNSQSEIEGEAEENPDESSYPRHRG